MELIAGDWRGCSRREIKVAMELLKGVRQPQIVSLTVNYGISFRPNRATKTV